MMHPATGAHFTCVEKYKVVPFRLRKQEFMCVLSRLRRSVHKIWMQEEE